MQQAHFTSQSLQTFLKDLTVILHERLPAAARHLFHDRYRLVDVSSTLLSIKRHYSLTRQAKGAALFFFNSINSHRAEFRLRVQGSV